MTRHDLLQNTNFSAVSGDFTHFSRSANYPSYSPATPTMINPNLADVRFASAGTITHYRDDGSTGTYTVAAGDPLLQHRFSLAKLAWLTYKGPSADITPTTDPLYNANGTDAAILACFGLTWDATNRQWNYTAEDTSSGTIKTLSAVATEGREPNFFEMLKAGIADGSLGPLARMERKIITLSTRTEIRAPCQYWKVVPIFKFCASAPTSSTALTPIIFPQPSH